MMDDQLEVLELYERYTSDGEMFLTGAFGGVRLFIRGSRGPSQMNAVGGYTSRRAFKAINHDRTRPTKIHEASADRLGWRGGRVKFSSRASPSGAIQDRLVPFVCAVWGLWDDAMVARWSALRQREPEVSK